MADLQRVPVRQDDSVLSDFITEEEDYKQNEYRKSENGND